MVLRGLDPLLVLWALQDLLDQLVLLVLFHLLAPVDQADRPDQSLLRVHHYLGHLDYPEDPYFL